MASYRPRASQLKSQPTDQLTWFNGPSCMFCSTYRLAAYRHFTLWAQRKLGRRVRRKITACAVTKIRAKFPEEDGNYRPLTLVRFDNQQELETRCNHLHVKRLVWFAMAVSFEGLFTP